MNAHLIFDHCGTRYAIAAKAVETTFWLPEMSPLEDLPTCFVGLMNLHEEVIPLVDLGVKFGRPIQSYRVDQSVVLLKQQERKLGLIVDEVIDLQRFEPDVIEPYVELIPAHDYRMDGVIQGCVRWEDAVLILLDAEELFRLLLSHEPLVSAGDCVQESFAHSAAFDGLTEFERDKLRQRTRLLAQPHTTQNETERTYALIDIDGTRFGIDSTQVSEFTRLTQITPIPCCPSHILGCVNLRGDVLPVLDLSTLLLNRTAESYRHLVVVRTDAGMLALAVHQVLDIRSYPSQATESLQGQAYGLPHCVQLLRDQDGVAGVIDLAQLMKDGSLEVNETV